MKNYNILVVDDEETQRDLLTGYLKKKGFKLFSASSGNDAIDIVKNNLVDIVLSDFKMPDKTGKKLKI